MNKGDTIGIALNYSYNGTPLVKDGYSEIELQLEPQGSSQSVKLLMSEGRITWDSDVSKYVAVLSQEETMKLPDIVKYQVRIKFGEAISSSATGSFNLGELLSRKVL